MKNVIPDFSAVFKICRFNAEKTSTEINDFLSASFLAEFANNNMAVLVFIFILTIAFAPLAIT